MNSNSVTKEQVLANMQDVLTRTEYEFGKPVTYVTVRMQNGFTLRESTTCVDPNNYDEEIGKKICLEKIEDKVWFLLGYQLQEKIHIASLSVKERVALEFKELEDKYLKLHRALGVDGFREKVGDYQYKLLREQELAMEQYHRTLAWRLADMENQEGGTDGKN